MNKISVFGRMASDVQLNEVNGRSVAKFRVAANNTHKTSDGKYGTNFYSVSIWGQRGDNAAKFLKKGHRVAVSGDLVVRQYTGSDGKDYTAIEINNADFCLVETRGETGGAQSAPPAAAPKFTQVETDDDVPF